MRYPLCLIATLFLIVPASYQAVGQEVKQEAKPNAQTREMPSEAKAGKHGDPPGAEKLFIATVGLDGIQHVEIVGGEYYFEPNHIVVKVNTPVELKVKKAGFVPHNIIVKAPEAGIDFKADLGRDWKTITFTPTKAGKYEMICDKKLLWFKSHKDRGMEGALEVVE